VQLAAEEEYITGAGIFATTNDGATLKPFLEYLKQMLGGTYRKIVIDAGYESEEHYVYRVENGQEAYIKPANYERMKTGKFRKDISTRGKMAYDETRDEYTCANGKTLRTVRSETRVSKSGYESEATVYARTAAGVRFGKGVRHHKRTGRWRYQKSCLPAGKPRG
jgi:hypothetical protein